MSEKRNDEKNLILTEDIFKILCGSVQATLAAATGSAITFSPMVQKIEKTCLKPDIGCFVLFGGDFSGLVIMNFTEDAAMEIYRRYMVGMGMPEEELAGSHTSEEVSNSLGELMNQCIGRFRVDLEKETTIFVSQNQPKMMVVNEAVEIAIEAGIDRPQLRRISFKTSDSNRFHLEISLGEITFYPLFPFTKSKGLEIDQIIAGAREKKAAAPGGEKRSKQMSDDDLEALMKQVQKETKKKA